MMPNQDFFYRLMFQGIDVNAKTFPDLTNRSQKPRPDALNWLFKILKCLKCFDIQMGNNFIN